MGEGIMMNDLGVSQENYKMDNESSEYLWQVESIMKKLVDKQSVDIFKTRVNYLLDRNMHTMENRLFEQLELPGSFVLDELEKVLPHPEEKRIVLFGCGPYGSRSKRVLEKLGYEVYAICDNYYTGSFEGMEVISPKEAALIENAFFIVSSMAHRWDIYVQLLYMGIKRENAFVPVVYDGMLIGYDYDKQYFDVFSPGGVRYSWT
jgi:hypothetical protein